jgi:hypothetical protein
MTKKQEKRPDSQVDHPPHYGGKDDPYEVIKVIVAWQLGFHRGNAIKYIARAGKKNHGPTVLEDMMQDLQKARWYLDNAIRLLQEGDFNASI